MSKFRNYSDSEYQTRVERTYRDMIVNQTLDYVISMKKKYSSFPNKKINIWDTINNLNSIIDESDPDSDLPQIIHAYQTAESLNKKYLTSKNNLRDLPIYELFNKDEWDNLPNNIKINYEQNINSFYHNIHDWDWLPLIGFIHDLGKVLLLEDFNKLPQWSVVGDTFPLGQKLDSSYVFYDKNYHLENKDLLENTLKPNIGFENIYMSWGHDEYLANILEKNSTNFPPEAIYIIRFHSFYSWHSPRNGIRGYTQIANEKDWYMLPLLKLFQKSDLYSKTTNVPDTNTIKNKYDLLINKYFNDSNILW